MRQSVRTAVTASQRNFLAITHLAWVASSIYVRLACPIEQKTPTRMFGYYSALPVRWISGRRRARNVYLFENAFWAKA